MAKMSRYVKAYSINRMREFPGWIEKIPVGSETEENETYLFLHESLVVTKGVFVDTDIVYDDITPAWEDFCATQLQFSLPPDVAKLEPPAGTAEKNRQSVQN
jgi:hypothetical protein